MIHLNLTSDEAAVLASAIYRRLAELDPGADADLLAGVAERLERE